MSLPRKTFLIANHLSLQPLYYIILKSFFFPSLPSSLTENAQPSFSFFAGSLVYCVSSRTWTRSVFSFFAVSSVPDTTTWLRGGPKILIWPAKWRGLKKPWGVLNRDLTHRKLQFFLPSLRISQRQSKKVGELWSHQGRLPKKPWPCQGPKETRTGSSLFNRFSALPVSCLKYPFPPKIGD